MDRIELLASLCKDAISLVDCGCDHGYVAIKAIKEYGLKHAYLLDINEMPLNNARNNCLKSNVLDKCDFILSDGLLNYDSSYDTLLIAGMGGLLIKDILEKSITKAKKFKHLILEANSMTDKLRGFLISNGFIFTNEHLINDNKHNYEIIEGYFSTDIKNKVKYDLLDMKFGPILRRNPSQLFLDIIKNKKEHFTKCLTKVTNEDSKVKLVMELSFIKLLEGTFKND